MSMGKLKRRSRLGRDDDTESDAGSVSKPGRKYHKEEDIVAANMERKAKKKRRLYEDSDDDTPNPPSKAVPSVSKLSALGDLAGTPISRGLSGNDKPAELFRKDLISAMKLADSEPLLPEDYVLISDPWRQEWEKGVQVPVNLDTIKEPKINVKSTKTKCKDFKLPRKLLHATQDENYKQGIHELTGMTKLVDQVCRYDLDNLDVKWLHLVNKEREDSGNDKIEESEMEKILEEFETKCHEKMQETIKTSEGMGLEWDKDIICDVCRSPDSEDQNEMVFCDSCDICVHQACYGIKKVPEGNWLCRTCALGIKPQCILCPQDGGAMKSTKSGTKWAHVSCALWIPEVSIGDAEKMEPITKISQIPSSRWSLTCSLCKQKNIGACIQCSVRTCKTAFHVTCAFSNSLEMKTMLDDSNQDVQLRAHCSKHSRRRTTSEGGSSNPGSPKKELTHEEQENMRQNRIEELEDKFYTCVDSSEVARSTEFDSEVIDLVYEYWKLKRKSRFNKPLMMPRREENDLFDRHQEDSLIARMKMFIHLRQDLERVRNLCYMVTRREKTSRIYYKHREEVFHKQSKIITNHKTPMSAREVSHIVKIGRSEPTMYDQPDLHVTSNEAKNQEVQRNLDKISTSSSEDGTESVGSSSPSSVKENKDSVGVGARHSPRHSPTHRKTDQRTSGSDKGANDTDSDVSCMKTPKRLRSETIACNLNNDSDISFNTSPLRRHTLHNSFSDSQIDKECAKGESKDINCFLKYSKFQVDPMLKKRIQSQVFRSHRDRVFNHLQEENVGQRSLDSFFKPIPRPPDRRLSPRDKVQPPRLNGTPKKFRSHLAMNSSTNSSPLQTRSSTDVNHIPSLKKANVLMTTDSHSSVKSLSSDLPQKRTLRSGNVRQHVLKDSDSDDISSVTSTEDSFSQLKSARGNKHKPCDPDSDNASLSSADEAPTRRRTRSMMDESSHDSFESESTCRYSMRSRSQHDVLAEYM